jgi:hypothetical protein
MGLMIVYCGKAVKRMGMLRVSVWKIKAPLTARIKTETLVGKGR